MSVAAANQNIGLGREYESGFILHSVKVSFAAFYKRYEARNGIVKPREIRFRIGVGR